MDMTVIQTKAQVFGQQILDWLQSPPFLAQIGAVVAAVFLAKIFAGMLKKRVGFLREEPKEGKYLKLQGIAYRLKNLIYPAFLVGLLAGMSAGLTSVEMLGQDWLVRIAQGLAVVFFLFKIIKEFISHPIVQKLVIWIVIPVAVLKVFGWYDQFQGLLQTTALPIGEIKISVWTVANLLIFGGILFWIGNLSNSKGKAAIRKQDSLDGPTKEVFSKIFEMLLFLVLFVALMGIAGIPMGSILLIAAPLSLGIGLGLQPVAANFVSGMILLLDRSLRVGDYIVLPDGREGYVDTLNMRSATIETTDGKDIMVPNTVFTEDSYENWTHKDPRQRYEVYFSVSYETDIDTLEAILIPAVSKHPKVLQEPEEPDLELREFGDSGIKFAIEFWADGIDDGENKFTSDLNFIVWRTLKKHNISMPLPQHEVRILK